VAGLLALSAIIVLWRAGLAWVLARVLNPYLPIFVALAVLSVAWSIDPSLSVRRLVRMFTMVLACTAFVLIAWHARRCQNVVRPILTIMLLGSILFGLAFPTLAIIKRPRPSSSAPGTGLRITRTGSAPCPASL
jgi:hypothetical protein